MTVNLTKTARQLLWTTTAGALLALAPASFNVGSETSFQMLGAPVAFAKGGRDDRDDDDDRDDRDDRDDDDDDDDDDRSDRDDRDDDRGRGRGGDRDRSGRRGGDADQTRDGGRRDRRDSDNSSRNGGFERSLSDGGRIEIENGRFERKNAAGRTVLERPATAADYALFGLTPPSGTASSLQSGRESPGGSRRGGGTVAKAEVQGNNIEVVYTDGWKEEIENGRYELKDDLNRTVIERPATQSDRDRLSSALR